MPDHPRAGRKRGGSRAKRRATRTETSAGGVVFRADGENRLFLLIKDPYQNWGLPKGHIEGGETPEQAALREIREETSLTDVTAEGELPTIDWYFRDQGQLVHKVCHFFLVQSRYGEARPELEEGISDCVWLSFEEAMRTLTYDNARSVLRSAGERLGVLRTDAAELQD